MLITLPNKTSISPSSITSIRPLPSNESGADRVVVQYTGGCYSVVNFNSFVEAEEYALSLAEQVNTLGKEG